MAGTGGVWRAGWRLPCHPERSNGGLEDSNGSEEKRGRQTQDIFRRGTLWKIRCGEVKKDRGHWGSPWEWPDHKPQVVQLGHNHLGNWGCLCGVKVLIFLQQSSLTQEVLVKWVSYIRYFKVTNLCRLLTKHPLKTYSPYINTGTWLSVYCDTNFQDTWYVLGPGEECWKQNHRHCQVRH